MFQRATRKKSKLRLAICGVSGSGKTYSALRIAAGLGGKIAMLDTESGSGELYSDLTEYDVCQINAPYTPEKYLKAIHEAERLGYSTIIIDSFSHAWAGDGGLLAEVDKRRGKGNDFTAWRDITPMYNSLINAILASPCHVIVTMRSKQGYEMQKDEKGKVKPVKVGLAPVQRDGVEYEFTVVLDIDAEKHLATASKDRTSRFDNKYFIPTEETGRELADWLNGGEEAKTIVASAPITSPIPTTTTQGQPVPDVVSRFRDYLDQVGFTDNRDYMLAEMSRILRKTVESPRQLTKEEMAEYLDAVQSN